jgi:hypothetical protein
VQLNEYELNSQLMPFETWHTGEELFESLDKEFDLLDRDIRPFVEECDHMQGFQFFSGVDDAWGGFAAKYLDNLRDEYGKTSIWVWGVEDCSRVVKVRGNCSDPGNLTDRIPLTSKNNSCGLATLQDQFDPLGSKHLFMSALPRLLLTYLAMSICRQDLTG